MSYSHDSSTSLRWAELLASALWPAAYEPSPSVIGDVAMRQVTINTNGSVLTRTVTLYPNFVNGRAQGCVCTSSFLSDALGVTSHHMVSCWFSWGENYTASDLATAIACAWQALK